MNRRSFFRSLGIATAALYLRIAPTVIKAVEMAKVPDYAPIVEKVDDAFRVGRGGMMVHKGRKLTASQMLYMNRLAMLPDRENYLATCPKWESV